MKRIFCLSLILSFILLSCVISASALTGDMNGDDYVTAVDYIALKRHILGTYELNESALSNADINQDGQVDARDYLFLKRIVLGTITAPEGKTEEKSFLESLEEQLPIDFSFEQDIDNTSLSYKGYIQIEKSNVGDHSYVIAYLITFYINETELYTIQDEIPIDADQLQDVLEEILSKLPQ